MLLSCRTYILGIYQFLLERANRIASIASLDTYTLDFLLSKHQRTLNTSSNDLIILSEMMNYKTKFMLRKEEVGSEISEFLVSVGEEQLAGAWIQINNGTTEYKQLYDIDVEKIEDNVLKQNIRYNTNKALTKYHLLIQILQKFAMKARGMKKLNLDISRQILLSFIT